MRGILAMIWPWDRSTNSFVPIYVGASKNSRTLSIGGVRWETAFVRLPRVSMEFVDDDITGQLMLARGDMTLAAGRIKQVADVDALDWVGAQVFVWSGNGPLLSDMRVEFKGRVVSGVKNKDTGQIPLALQVDRRMVDVPLLNLEYGGGGGADGDPEVRGQLKPAAFGRPINVPVFFFDQVNNVGQIDGYGGMIDCLELYEDGGRFGDSIGNFATYDALVAADIPEGSWGKCIAEGMIRLGAPPVGVITADPVCHGDRPGSMALRWLTIFAGVSEINIDLPSFDALTAQVEALLGHEAYVSYWTQSQVNVLDRLQTLAASCNAMPLLGIDGRLSVSRVFGGDVQLLIDRQGGRPLVTGWRTFDPTTPWWRLKMTAATTYRVHTPAEIDYEDDIDDRGDYVPGETYRIGQVARNPADGIRYLYTANEPTSGNAPPNPAFWEVYEDAPDASVVKYVDGTPLEALKPAQAGADQTSMHTASSIAGQGMLATDDYVQFGSNVYRQNGVTAVTDATAITALGTAASIAGQGTLATRGDVYFGSAMLLESAGGAQATIGNFKTSVGTASAIAGQGALATLAQVNLGASGRVYRDDGVTRLTDALAVTSIGTASGIAGQGALATLGQVNLGTSGRVYRDDGFTKLTDSLAVTSLGTASAIAGQGALATLAQVNLGASGRVYRDDGTTRLTDALAVTALGTASAIAGQGAFATVSTAAYGSGLLTGFGTLAPRNNVRLANEVYRADGTTVLSEVAAVTSLGTASGIAGQGALATLGQVQWGSTGRVYRDDGVTRVTDASSITSIGTAAGIAGQGGLATRGDVYFGSSFLLEASAGAQATLGNFKTSIGTASAISGQGTLATASQVNFGTSGRVYRDDGVTRVTDTLAITALGTASAISGQGALATRADVYFGSTYMLESAGGAQATLSSFKTAMGTASAISGQGALATLSAASWSTQVTGAGKPSSFATANVTFGITAAAGAVYTQEGNSFTVAATGAENGFWIASDQGISGPFVIRFRHNGGGGVYVGFTPIKSGWAGNAGYGAAFGVAGAGVVSAQNWGGDPSGVTWAYAAGDLHEYTFDGRVFRYLLNGVSKRTITNDIGTTLYYFTAIFNFAGTGARLYDIEFFPANDKRAYRDDAATVMGQAEIRTAEGTSSAIAGQGSLATRSDVYFGSALLLETAGGAQATLTNFKTANGTASGIAGQGALATKSTANLDTDVAEGTTYKRVAAADVGTSGVLKLAIAGSGRRVGDARNLPPVSAMNVGYKFTGTVTYSASSAGTATISVSAGSALIGSTPPSYNAMSVGVTGTPGTTVLFNLYVDENADTSTWGGTKTLVATLDGNAVLSGDNRMWVGGVSVFFPSTGTSSGSGGGGGGGGRYDNGVLP